MEVHFYLVDFLGTQRPSSLDAKSIATIGAALLAVKWSALL